MGLSAAYQLAGRGVDVLVVERSLPGLEASAANAGTLGIQNKPLALVPPVIRAIAMWQELARQSGIDLQYEKRGGFRLAHNAADVQKLEAGVRAQRALGVTVEMVYQPQLAREAPYLGSTVLAASYCPDDGMANPLAATRALVRASTSVGARIRNRCAVTAIEARGDQDFLVQTASGSIHCTTIICAAGAWNGDVARMVGIDLPITTDVLQVVTTDISPPLFPHILTHVRGNLTVKQARVTGKILIGGAWRGEGDRTTGIKRVRRDSLIGNLKWATQNVPGITQARLLRSWVGFEGRTPDKLLLSGPARSPRGFHVLGCSGGGFTVAPFAGLLAALYVLGEAPPMPVDRFHVGRYA
jgi:glycine/D-amino acid oxidase-like deaminating enzyme